MRVDHYLDVIRFIEILLTEVATWRIEITILSKVLKFFNYSYHDIVKLILIPEPVANPKRHILPRLLYSNHPQKQNKR